MKDLLDKALAALAPLLIATLTAFVGLACKWIVARTTNEKVKRFEEKLAGSVATVVKSLSANVVQAIKDASEDGTIDAAEREKIKALAMAELRAYWGERGTADLMSALGFATDAALKTAVDHDIEAAVWDMKLETKAAESGGTVVPNPLVVK